MDCVTDISCPKTRFWKENIEKLLFKNDVCGICLSEEHDLEQYDAIFSIENGKKEMSLNEILGITFGRNIWTLLPTPYICGPCISEILQSFFLLKKIRSNHAILQKYFNILTQQAVVSSETKKPTEKQLFLTIDNINSLNVPTTVTKKDKENNITQIFLCEVDDSDTADPDFDFENSNFKYECPYCGKQFQDYVTFKDHYIQHKEIYYRCHKCLKRFKFFNELIKHRNAKHLDILVTCDFCKIILLSPDSVEHEQEHPVDYMCPVCQISFNGQSDLERHNTEQHAYESCHKCMKTFSNTLKLEHHRCPYKCHECKEECVHEKYLALYKEQHMGKATVFKCPDCDFAYSNKCQIVSHANEAHLNHFPYLCELCGDNFASRPNLTTHLYKTHTEETLDYKIKEGSIVSSVLSERPYECNLCNILFNSEASYKTHRRKHLTDETQCQLCEKSFHNIGQLNIHIKKPHPDEVNKRNVIYRCAMCPMDFKLRADFLKHVPTHPKGTKYVCRYCSNSFQTKRDYNFHDCKHRAYDKQCPICFNMYTKHTISRHMRSHIVRDNDGNTNLICNVCGTEISNHNALIKHAEKHEEKRQCPHCYVMVNSVLYSMHVSTHIQSDKHLKSCSECNYTTKFAVCLEAHINRHHLKVRPYRCDVCDKTFYSHYTLKGHKATHKDVRPEHYCHICGNKFISKKAVICHTRIHTGEAPYPCELCDLSFLSASRRRQHMIRKHFEPSCECEICSKKLYTQSDLRRHIRDCHDGETKRKRSRPSESMVVETEQCDVELDIITYDNLE